MSLGFYFNQQRCYGCRACVIACKDYNDLEVGNSFRRVTSYESGHFPPVRWISARLMSCVKNTGMSVNL